ncbi:DUF2946 family protein [Alcaligenes nematophilus]|uniref:DUF2946 family protein n=1 Tax=Alcaligenes nematophilus TaxID=2994643 RepID=A0ABU3MPL6_9BURK|nr:MULTISPECIES: DUF2946 family protein [Alcaligenes]MDT8465126.1 DUF2946 family protein [Alcaligenes nematophilus]MDT8470260.1 DUF2946 family protein [Alcaligenes nematophilus]MDT8503567.1 DUF2946 family protein [Alcaligenes nematophilus]MDT8526420.1 DUF2946 family protein [Alcaligenes nematophilus]UUO10270.1 DUF2946 family protein [Alcaligenes faecalis]
MDAAVKDAMKKWPNVPAVSGYISLDQSGHWRHHPAGDANQHPEQVGERIAHQGLLAFFNRNYQADEQGRWFIQNGPQRVYVRLDAAPLIVSLAQDQAHLQDHTGRPVETIQAWYISAEGRLYLRSSAGPALLAGRDVPALLEQLRTDQHGLESLDLEQAQRSEGWSLPAYPQACSLTVWSSCVSPAEELAYIVLPEPDPI